MTALTATTFLARLPERLTPAEAELREHLLGAAYAAQRLFPPGDVVSLQQWAENRIPGELELGTDENGLVILKIFDASRSSTAKSKVVATADDTVIDSNTSNPAALKAFLQKLPQDSFEPKEEALRDAILAVLEKGPVNFIQVKRDAAVIAAAKFIPPNVALEDWIERRIGAEVTWDSEERSNNRVIRTVGDERPFQSNKEATKASFWDTLPKDSFHKDEDALRLTIFDFLAAWASQELATLSHVGNDPNVRAAIRKLLPSAIPLKEWVERRIGGELQLQQNKKGQFEIILTPIARPFMAERVALLRSRTPPPVSPPLSAPVAKAAAPKGREDRPKAREELPQDRKAIFFKQLPTDELLPAELELREVIISHLDRARGNDGINLSILGNDKVVQKLKSDFLKGVSMRDWIDRRIGGEVATKNIAHGQVQLMYRKEGVEDEDEPEVAPVTDSKATDRARPKPKEDTELKMDRTAAMEAFFASLPADGFTPEEELLREAVLQFLEEWKDSNPPTLSMAGSNSLVSDARAECLPRASGVSLRQWIDRRIGGEVATWNDRKTSEIFFGLREQWGEVADATAADDVTPASKKRKTDDYGGKGQRNGGGRWR